MAIVIGSTFKPFDYATMNNPVAQATEEHKLLEDAYGELATKASIWEGMANQQADPKAYQTYLQYASDLQDQANVLAKQGLNPVAKRALNDMKSRYAQEITPIEQAYQKREAGTAEQRKARLQNPTIIFDRDFSTTSLDELIENPSLSYTNINGDVITKQVAEAASNLARQVKTDPRRWHEILDQQYYETIMKKGLSDQEILATISQTEGGRRELQKIIDSAINTSGVMSWNNPDALNQVREYANRGAWAAIGDVDWKTLQNHAFQGPSSGTSQGSTLPLEVPMVPVASITRSTPYNKDLKTYKDISIERNQDGSYKVSNAHIKELESKKAEAEARKKKIESANPEVKDPKYKPAQWSPIPGTYTGNNSGAETKASYERELKKIENIDKEIKEYTDKTMKVVERLRPLGDTEEQALGRGLAIEKAQGNQQIYGYPILTSQDSGDKLAALQNFRNTIKTLPDSTRSGLVLLDSKFKPKDQAIKAKEAKEILNKPDAGISVYPGIGFVVTSGDDLYLIRGVGQFDQATDRMQKVNDFLQNFTDGKIREVPNMDSDFGGDYTTAYDYARKNGESLGDGMFGVMVKRGDDIHRIVFRPLADGSFTTYESSANDEIANKGALRGKNIHNMAIAELPYLLTISEGISRPSGTASSKMVGYTQE